MHAKRFNVYIFHDRSGGGGGGTSDCSTGSLESSVDAHLLLMPAMHRKNPNTQTVFETQADF